MIVTIVVPTYNESKNIVSLLDKIYANVKANRKRKNKVSLNVLVVDDSSPDGTGDIVKKYMKKNKKVLLLTRKEKEGLGAAYIAGMKYALEKTKPDVIFEMDADHSHNPDDIFRMIGAIERGADFVIGSRYVEGGKIPKSWGIHRKLFSFFASSISRIGLGLGRIKDCSGGFRAIRSRVLKKVDLDGLNVKGYAFQAALLEASVRAGFRVKEIPIAFDERNLGTSKMRVSDMLEGWKVIYQVRMKRLLG